MVDVGVGDENLLELEAELGEAALDAGDLVAGIDDDGLAGLFVAEDGAVAGERADGEGFEDHGFYCKARSSSCVPRSGLRREKTAGLVACRLSNRVK